MKRKSNYSKATRILDNAAKQGRATPIATLVPAPRHRWADKAYQMGFDAFHYGDDNPFVDENDKDADTIAAAEWQKGWDDARNEYAE